MSDLFNAETKIEIKVHLVADIFPMMSDEELADLAADIKANGQVHPILLDCDGLLLDGRNRARACEIAGVKPLFATIAQPIPDPLAYVVSLNVKRRNMSASQKAMSAAEAWAIAEKEERVQTKGGDRKSKAQNGHLIRNPREHFATLFGVSKNYVEMGHALLRDDPTEAARVKKGGPAALLKDAYDAMAKRQGGDANNQIRMRKLREERPDLAEKVEAESMTLEDAERTAKKDAEERKQQRWALTMNVLDAVRGLDRDPDKASEIAAEYDPAQAEGRGETLTPDRLRKVAAFASALANAMEEHS
jgi:ParB-like chromosome segregation protein Spo0J